METKFFCVIALLDYGSGNLHGVHKSLLKVGADARKTTVPTADPQAAGGQLRMKTERELATTT